MPKGDVLQKEEKISSPRDFPALVKAAVVQRGLTGAKIPLVHLLFVLTIERGCGHLQPIGGRAMAVFTFGGYHSRGLGVDPGIFTIGFGFCSRLCSRLCSIASSEKVASI